MDIPSIAAVCLTTCLVLPTFGQVNAPYDPSYGAGINWNGFAGSSCTAIALERLADGDLHLVGLLNPQSSRTVVSARLDTNGIVREGYGRFGAITDIAGSIGNGYSSRAHVFPDGSHLVLGYPGSILCKYLPDGSPDPGFGTDGRVHLTPLVGGFLGHLGVLPSGRIILGGRPQQANQFMLVGLTPTGAIDPAFGNEGIVVRTDLFECEGLDVLPDGRSLCLATGNATPFASTLVMFNEEGSLDAGFMASGLLSGLPPDVIIEDIRHYEYLPDGRILLCDDERTARLLADGSGADPTFIPRPLSETRWMELMDDGSVYLTAAVNWRLYHLLPDGQFDPGFGPNGFIHVDPYRSVNGVLPTSEGLFVYGQLVRTDNSDEMGVTRLFTDGSVDSSFANHGTGGYNGHNENLFVADMTVDPSGRVLGIGGNTQNNWLARLDAEGRPDTAFAQFGVSSPYYQRFDQVVTQSNGHVLVFGTQYDASTFNGWPELVRFNEAGQRLNFNVIDLGALNTNYQFIRDVQVAPDDGVYIILSCNPGSTNGAFSYVGRLLPDGTYDPSFGTNGIFEDPYLPLNTGGHCIGLFPNGDVLAVQTVQDSLSFSLGYNKMQLRRLSPQGTPVTTWGLAGRVRTDLLGTGGLAVRPNQLAVLPDGAFLIQYTGFGYDEVPAQYLARFLESGSLDPTFGNGGVLALGFQLDTYPSNLEMVVQANGRITFSTEVYADGSYNFELVRLMPDGGLDLSFGSDGRILLGDLGGPWLTNVDLALHPTGQVVVSGCVNSDTRWLSTDWFTFRLLDDFTTDARVDRTPDDVTRPVAYPNPATSHTRIAYSLDRASVVSIQVLDMKGHLVADLGRLQRSAGAHEELLTWPERAAAGTYLARIQCADRTRMVPVVLVR